MGSGAGAAFIGIGGAIMMGALIVGMEMGALITGAPPAMGMPMMGMEGMEGMIEAIIGGWLPGVWKVVNIFEYERPQCPTHRSIPGRCRVECTRMHRPS